MTRKSLCQQLTDICKPELYSLNPFQVLQVFPFSPERLLRRRKEELEAARGLGEEAWNAEFEGCLDHDNYYFPPWQELIEKLFERLDNPQQRLIDEFFWFWPLESPSEEALEAIRLGNFDKACSIWEDAEESGNERNAAIAKHNLTIVHHFRVVVDEKEYLMLGGISDGEIKTFDELDEEWKYSFELWEELLCDNGAWDILKERVASGGDQRLSAGFVQRMRDELPRALKLINSYFAVDCIELMWTGEQAEEREAWDHNCREDLKRHWNYMETYFSAVDNAESRQDCIMGLIEERVDNRVRNFMEAIGKRPKSILKKGFEIIGDTDGYRDFVEEKLGRMHPFYGKICDKIADFCNHCAVSVGNDAEKIGEAIRLLENAIPIPQSISLKATMQENLDFLRSNLQELKMRSTCGVCQERPAEDSFTLSIQMYGKLQTETELFSNKYRTTWSTVSVKVPRCRECAKLPMDQNKLAQCPAISKMLKDGFQKGEKPSEGECKLHYVMTQKALLLKESLSWTQ